MSGGIGRLFGSSLLVHCHQEGGAGNECHMRAETEKLREVFNKYATVVRKDEKFIGGREFIRNFLGLFNDEGDDDELVELFARIADTTNDGLISFAEFQAFEGRLCDSDALYRTVFQLFDRNRTGFIGYHDFMNVIKRTELYLRMPIDLDSSSSMNLYFGNDKKKFVNYAEFDQLLHDFRQEYGREVFRKFDHSGGGVIKLEDFEKLVLLVNGYLLTDAVKNNIRAAVGDVSATFPYFVAFTSLLNNTELIERIYFNAAAEHGTREVTKDEFLKSAQMVPQITLLEVDILFRLCHLVHPRNGKIISNDLKILSPCNYNRRLTEIRAVSNIDDGGFTAQILESVYRFSLGSVSGAIGAMASYPIDLVKTRMQNQRSGLRVGTVMYKNSFDCFRKVIKYEGFFGLYRGLLPQLMGTAPEKAIKLTVNDLLRDKLSSNGKISLVTEVFCGASAGFLQVFVTNPLEIVKVRLQVAGEVASGAKLTALNIVKELGLSGLYKGASACFPRVMINSGIYFPTYHNLKLKLADDTGHNSPSSLLMAGCTASIPATAIATPFDVVKTRLQVVARTGQTVYNGFFDCVVKLYREEGARAFWKGTAARILRSSPQYGVTLFSYELLQRVFQVDFGRPGQSESERDLFRESKTYNADHIGGYRLAVPIIDGIESKYGLSFPKFKTTMPPKS